MKSSEFDSKAKEWDENPQRQERTQTIAQNIKTFLDRKNLTTALEFGCGTGELSYLLKDEFTQITLVDTSQGMIDVLNEKIAKFNLSHFKPQCIDLLNEPFDKKFDIIYTAMSMHHVHDIDKILKKFHGILNDGGYLCIIDLDKEDGTFHGPDSNFNGHLGFDETKFSQKIENLGFTVEDYFICYEMTKEIDNVNRTFPLFMLTAQKKEA